MFKEQAIGIFWDGVARHPGSGSDSGSCSAYAATGGEHCMRQAMLRILRCTALAFKQDPGGLRFVPGSRPWLPCADDEQWASP